MSKNHEEVATEVRKFLAENFILDDGGAGLGSEESLTQSGVLDSMGVLELITFIEERFGISVPDEDALPENLDSIKLISGYVSRRLMEAAAA